MDATCPFSDATQATWRFGGIGYQRKPALSFQCIFAGCPYRHQLLKMMLFRLRRQPGALILPAAAWGIDHFLLVAVGCIAGKPSVGAVRL